jgi:hypothetical protein
LALEEDSTPDDAEHLSKTKCHYRIYVYRSLYRAVYRVLSEKRIVPVERVGPRGSVFLQGGFRALVEHFPGKNGFK